MIEVDDYSANYSTKAELKFIDGLGSWSELKTRNSALLAGYLDGCFKRINWGEIDYLEVIRYATKLLEKSIPNTEEPLNG